MVGVQIWGPSIKVGVLCAQADPTVPSVTPGLEVAVAAKGRMVSKSA